MRLDEQATQSIIERNKKSDENIKTGLNTAKNLALTATGVSAISGISSKVAPFLSEYLTPDIAIKGIKKVVPKIGDFLERGMKAGLTAESGLDFIKENFMDKAKSENKVDSKKNVLSQYSPELQQFIELKIGEGNSATKAAGIAFGDKKFKPIIDKMIKDHNLGNFGFFDLVESLYEKGKSKDQSKAALHEEPQQMEQQPQQQPMQAQQQQQSGPGEQKLMQILQQLNQKRM